ncbi:MAG: amino acid adenylation domain-containing protein, partial [Longimicrobiaceae bacterium]
RPELTAERFVPDPFAAEPGARMYRTGDRARWLAEGELEYLGRIDQQVKVRGFRIEPGEVEAVLRAHPAVGEAVVAARPDGSDGVRLVAYHLAAEGAARPEAAELRAWLRERLPEYMVPSAFVALDAFPLTGSGKLDRRALPEPAAEAAAASEFAAPSTPVEEILAGIWSAVLGVERVGVHDDFFALGGHSLLGTQVLSRIRAAFEVELPLRALFEEPTIAALAGRIGALRSDGSPRVAPPIGRVSREAPLPLSFGQQRLWVVDRLDPGSAAYNMAGALRLRGALDAAALRAGLGELARRHETLRTTFAERGGAPVQVIHAPAPVPLPVMDLRALPAGAREAEAERLAAAEAVLPFDLARGPLVRCTLLRLDDEDHVLCITMHHVVGDGWSIDVLVSELSSLYAAFGHGEPSPLAELPVQYADFAAWQREWLSGEVLEAQIGYWKARLAGVAPLLEVPTDHPRAIGQSPRAGTHGFVLSPAVAEALRALSRREGATLFMTLLAGWQALLGRYAGREDVVVGSPVAGRTRVETEGLIGFFVNMLALRGDLEGDPTWRELLGRTRETALGAFAHQDLPFERLVEELGVERSLAHAPVFQVTFALNRAAAAAGRLRLGEVEQAPFGTGAAAAKLELELTLADTGDALGGELVYRAALFEAATAARMAGHLEAVLEAMAAGPEKRISELSLLSEAESRQLASWNATAVPYPPDSVHERVSAQAAWTPEAVAVAFGGETLTYAELERRANRLANHLRRLGVRAEDRVGICLERSPELPVAMLAVLRAGGAYVPLDPGYPAGRLAMMLEDSGVRVLLTERALEDRLQAHPAAVVLLDAAREPIAEESSDLPPVASDGEQTAYVIYTSGSTGTPKGVAVPHRALANHMGWMQRAFPLAADDRVLQKTPAGFDASVWEFWAPLLAGATLVMAPPGVHRDPTELARVVERERVTVLQVVPSLLGAMLEAGGLERCGTLRRLFCGGEALPAEAAARARALTGAEVVNLYGPTEACIDAASHVFAGGDSGAMVPIGRPVDNVAARVLDVRGAPVPVGVPGELYLGGAQLARGYLGRPELTAERFVPDAFADVPGARAYRTGDRVRWLADGTLEFLGRIDQQVKVRGFRIEPGEVEAALRAHPAVGDAVVAARPDGTHGGTRLVAYHLPASGAARPSSAELRAWLRERLLEPMVPSAFVALETLPLTPGGKVDRRALPDPEPVGPGAAEPVPPSTPVEEILAGIWAELLHVAGVGIHDDFFALGGHSLLGTRVVSRVRDALGVELPLRALFEEPTIAGLAGHVETLLGDGAGAAPPIERVSREGALPPSFAQQRLWLVDRLEPGSPAYNMPGALRLRGGLDVPALRAALGALTWRHEALRTTFEERGGAPVQVIHPPAPVPLPLADLGGLPEERREAEAERLAAEEALRPFDLARGPLLRSALLRLGDADHVLLITLHHVVGDGWSMDVLQHELSALYDAFSWDEEPWLPQLPVQYADYAVWQRAWLSGETLERQIRYWKDRLRDAPPLLEIPTDHPRGAGLGMRGGSHRFSLPPVLTGRLRTLAQREGATLFMTTLAAWQALLGRWAGQDDVVVGTPVAGRSRRETEGLVGFFVNMLVLRADLAGGPTWHELLGRVRETALGAYDHQELPFERLVEELDAERSLTHDPVFQVTFQLDRAPARGGLALGDVAAEPFGEGAGVAKFDLALTLRDDGGALAGALDYRATLFEADTVARLAGHLEILLEAMVDEPARRVPEVPLLSDAERRQLASWNATAAAYPRGCVHELVSAQAARTPDAPAVSWRGASLSYAELETRANRLAGHLRRMGAGPESRVGVCLERTPELVVAMLGTLKAGAAYVPLDPAYPRERLGWMIEDAGVTLVLTSSALADVLPAGTRTLALDSVRDAVDAGPDEAPRTGVLPENLSHVIFTSGSTGRPKGVMIRHSSTVVLLHWLRENVSDEERSSVLFSTSINFDVSVAEVFGSLAWGGKLVLVENALELATLAEPVVHASMVPTAAAELLRMGGIPASVRTLNLGGEPLPGDLAQALYALPTVEKVGNLYGPTEDTTYSTYSVVERGASQVFVGRPVANTQALVLDAELQPVPVGVVGELYLAGDGLSRGYAGRPELTAERYLPNPFGAPGTRMYRVMDRIRWRADGQLEYFGRTDFQVKVRGFRIELGEIETALRSHPAVREAVAVV